MAFTSQLGTASSFLANIELGVIGQGMAAGTADPSSDFQYGPPIPGSPWYFRPRPYQLDVRQDPPTTVSSTMLLAGPPLPGAPWKFRPSPFQQLDHRQGAPQPFVITSIESETHVVTGPPIPGAPWRTRILITSPPSVLAPAGPVPVPPITTGKGFPFLERVPDDRGASAEDRLRRFTEKLSIIINSLFRKGQLVQTGQAEFDIVASGFATGSGATGSFTDSF